MNNTFKGKTDKQLEKMSFDDLEAEMEWMADWCDDYIEKIEDYRQDIARRERRENEVNFTK